MTDAAGSTGRRSWLGLLAAPLRETERVDPGGAVGVIIAVLSVATVAAVCYLALFGTASQHLQVSWFILLSFPIIFLTTTVAQEVKRLTAVDYLLALVSLALGAWFIWNEPRYQGWMRGFSELEWGDRIAAVALIALVCEMCRRAVGFGLTVFIPLTFAYAALGHLMIGAFRHQGIDLDFFLDMQTISTDGIFDSPLYVAASYAFLFVLFGNFFVIMGGGQLFFDVAAAITGRMIGGPAKACIVSSGLYGSISGSPVADVATTGPVSIPIMRRIGIPADKAAAIETASSCGGSMLPPVMGAVAFIMADFTNIPYARIALYALVPALLYYFAIFVIVHLEARTLGIGRLPEAEIAGIGPALARNWQSLLPIGALVWLLVGGYSAAYIAAGSTLAVLAASWLKPRGAIGPYRFVAGCVETCKSMVPLTASVAAAGLIMGTIELTGLSGKFTLLLFQLSGGMLIPSLVIAGIVLILLGTGMPTTGVYLMGVALIAPVLTARFGLPVMEVHMFMLFFACMSAASPPVAPAAFAAGAIAGANPFRVGWITCKLAFAGFLLPFMFIFNNGMLLQGSAANIAADIALGALMVITFALAFHGHVIRWRMPLVVRLAFGLAGAAIMWPDPLVQWSASALSMAMLALSRWRAQRS